MDKLKSNKVYAIVGILLVLIIGFVVISSGSGSSDGNSSGDGSASAGETYPLASSGGKVTGTIEITDVFSDGTTQFNYVFLINDDLENNGICQSNDPTYCDDALTRKNEEIVYGYALTFASTENTDGMLSTVLKPVYCQLDKIKENPLVVAYGADPYLDFACDGANAATWAPTTWFVARNGGSTDDLDALLIDLKLNIYDVRDLMFTTVENGGSSITYGPLEDYGPYNDRPLVTTYEVDVR